MSQKLHAAKRGARHQQRMAERKHARIVGSDPVHILEGRK
jgi:hypothetical protein